MNTPTIAELQQRIEWHQATAHHAREQAAEKRGSAEIWEGLANEAQDIIDGLSACVYFLEDSPQ